MIGFYDYTVILTYLSLMSGTIGIMLCLNGIGHPYLGMFFLLISGLCDTFDGKVARTKKDRTPQMKKFGIQIDSLSDLIAFGILPACIGIAMLRYIMYIPDLSGFTKYILTHYNLQAQVVLTAIAVLYHHHKGMLVGSEVGIIEHGVGIQYAHHTHLVEIQSLADHLRANEQIGLTRREIVYQPFVGIAGTGGVQIHTGDTSLGEYIRQLVFDAFGTQTSPHEFCTSIEMLFHIL